MEAHEDQGLIAREHRFRATLLSALAAASVTLAALLLYLLVPFFPPQISIFVAVALGFLAYKAPAPAAVAMVVLALPGFIYQLGPPPDSNYGLPLLVVVGMTVALFVPAAGAAQTGAVLGISTGATAAMLMLTPFHFLSLPLMVAMPLFRARGGKVGSTDAVVVFLALYFPILVSLQHIAQPTDVVPLFERLHLDMKPAVSVVDMGNMFNRLADAISLPGTESERLFYQNLTQYWPVGLVGRVPPLGFVLTLAFAFSIASAFGGLAFSHWLERREIGGARIKRFGPVASLFIADALFLIPLGFLSGPLAYTIEINPIGLILSTVAIGSVGASVEIWLGSRDYMIRLREDLGETLPRLSSSVQALKDRVAETRGACPRIDLSAEKGLAAKCEQELAFAADTIDQMTPQDLDQKRGLFQDLSHQLSQSLDESFHKLSLYYDEDRREYNEIIRSSAEFGVPLGKLLEGPPLSQLEPLGFAAVLELQRHLSAAYGRAAEPMAAAVTNLERTLRSELDPEFRRVGLEIARNYLTQAHHGEAVRTFLSELASIERQLCSMVEGLDASLVKTASDLRFVVEDSLLPLATTMGDSEGVVYYSSVLGHIVDIAALNSEPKKLSDLVDMVVKVRTLGDITAAVIARLSARFEELERTIESKVPQGYNWGKNPRVALRAENALNLLKTPGANTDVNERMSLIGSELKTIDEEILGIKQYAAVHEFLVNYVNIEYLINERLEIGAPVGHFDLPVKPTYARQYLRLFAEIHSREVFLDERTGMVRLRTMG